jgi:hypothetical protein
MSEAESAGTKTHAARRRPTYADLVRWTKAIADAEPRTIETAARAFGERRAFLAPVAWAAGTLVLLVRGIKLLVTNWRLTLIQLVPAAWIWLAMWDLKEHGLRGQPFRHLTPLAITVLVALSILVSIASLWCNTVFAFAIDELPPRIRPSARQANKHLARIAIMGTVIGIALGVAVAVIPRVNTKLLFYAGLGAVLGVMFISFVAVPARIIGRRPRKLPPKQAIGRTATGWALSGVAMTPGFILDRIGLILIGIGGLHVLGFLLLSVGTALYAAGMSSVKAVKMTIKFAPEDDRTG